jgi:predicted PolB exonuclease-like 3'-5' exonuclease
MLGSMTSTDSARIPMTDDRDATRFLIVDTESIPDGRLLSMVKYADEKLDEAEAVQRAQDEARERSSSGSDFLPVTFQYPVAVCVIRVGADFRLQGIKCLDAPEFRPAEIVRKFWQGMGLFPRAKLVTFNGRGFDLPLLELAAFRYGCSALTYFQNSRNRYNGNHLDLLDWLTNFGACRLAGGLNLLSKILGKPGKMGVSGDKVYAMYREGKKQAINDYCMFDTLDTYFVFLRTRVLAGEITLEKEQVLVREEAKAWISARLEECPALQQYLDNWGDWEAWP